MPDARSCDARVPPKGFASTAEADAWASRVSAGVAAGSREALAALYDATFDDLYLAVRSFTKRDESFLLDCVHDAMMRVARRLRTIDTKEGLDAWLRSTVLGAALDRLRGERAAARRERRSVDGKTSASETSVEVDAGAGQDLADIERELARLASLGHDDRSLLTLRFVRGLTLEQLANHFGWTPKAIDSRIRRLIARLRPGPPSRTGDDQP